MTIVEEVSPADGEGLPRATLVAILDGSPHGVAVVAPSGHYRYVNQAGLRTLNLSEAGFLGAESIFPSSPNDSEQATSRGVVLRSGPEGPRELKFESTEAVLPLSASPVQVVHFADVTDERFRARQVAAFATTVTSMIGGAHLGSVLEALASEVRQATGMSNCVVSLIEAGTGRTLNTGTAGLPDGFLAALTVCQSNGVNLVTVEAARRRQPLVVPGWRQGILEDELWAPVHAIVERTDWDTFVAVPLVLDDEVIGTLAGFHSAGKTPTDEDVQFLQGMAQHAALAVQHSRLLVEVRRSAVIDDRNRLARDLHDSVSQTLFSLSLEASALTLEFERQDGQQPPAVRQRLTDLKDLAKQASADMRQLIFHMLPETLRHLGLMSSIEQHARVVSRSAPFTVNVLGSSTIVCVNDAVERDVFLIIREALHNVAKHARASRVTVRISLNTPVLGSLRIEVEDDGVGFDNQAAGRGQGLGLASLRERSARHGGTFWAGTNSLGGATITMEIPNAHQ